MKKSVSAIIGVFTLIVTVLFVIFMITMPKDYKEEHPEVSTAYKEKDKQEVSEDMSGVMYIRIDDRELEVQLANNISTKSLVEKLHEGDIVVEAEDYGGFEKVGELGFSIPENNEELTTTAGDVILYQGDKITVYYDKNSWNFTKLGHINIEQAELKNILGNGNVTMTLSLKKLD